MVAVRALHRSELLTRGEGLDGLAARDRRLRGFPAIGYESWMLILIALVASENPSILIDPYGALVKDLCLIACAITVWTLGRTQFAPG